MLFALAFGVHICYHQTMDNTQYNTKTEKTTYHDYEKGSFFIKKDAMFEILKSDTSKIVLHGKHDYTELLLYSFGGIFHFNYVRLQPSVYRNSITCCLIEDRCLIGEYVVLTENVLKETASFCNPYVLEKMITVSTGVDASYKLEPINKTASLFLKGTD